MRLFIAAYLPEDVEKHFAVMADRLHAARTRYLVPVEHWHMTLAFVGEVPDAAVANAEAVVQELAGPAPTARIAGGKRLGRDGALVAGVRGEIGPFGDEVRRGLRQRGLTYDPRPLQPHVTIARKGNRMSAAELAADMAVLDAYEGPEWRVTDVRLVESQGAVYRPVTVRRLP